MAKTWKDDNPKPVSVRILAAIILTLIVGWVVYDLITAAQMAASLP